MVPLVNTNARWRAGREIMAEQKTAVILGGKGKTGSRVGVRLRALGWAPRLVSRSSEIPFDWNEPGTWERALSGAEALYITYAPDLAVPGAAEHVHAVSQAAVAAGIRRIVLLAGRNEPQVHPAEDAVREAGVEHTIVECGFFNQNFSEGVLLPVNDTIYFPAGETTEPFIDCDDIADVVVAALTEDRHDGQTYELTGPRCLSFHEVAEEIGRAAGRPFRYQPVSFDDYAEMLAPHMPPAHVEFFIELFRFLMDGHSSYTADGVQRVLGRPAKDFSDYVRANAEVWK